MIHEERIDIVSGKLRIPSQRAVLQTGQTPKRANPERSIGRSEQGSNPVVRELFIPWRPPRDAPNAVEAQQAEFRAEPEITVGRLSDGGDPAFGKPVAEIPRGVRVLIDGERGVQCERGITGQEEYSPRDNASRVHRGNLTHFDESCKIDGREHCSRPSMTPSDGLRCELLVSAVRGRHDGLVRVRRLGHDLPAFAVAVIDSDQHMLVVDRVEDEFGVPLLV